MVIKGHLSIGALVCCSLLSSRLTQPIIRGIGVWSELQNVDLAKTRCRNFNELAAPEIETDAKPISVAGAISFKGCFV